MKIATREIIREIDSKTIDHYGISGLILMENAGRASANLILSEYSKAKRIAIICGEGHNGGDGFVIARHLISAEKDVKTYLLTDKSKYKGDSKINLHSLIKIGGDISELKSKSSRIKEADIYVDAIFGTGLDREVDGFYKKIINYLNTRKEPVVSIDIPSGLDSNSGKPLGAAVKAASTITFIKPKIGMCIYPGVAYVGKLFITDITTPKILENDIKSELITFDSCKKLFKARINNTHKGTYGHLFILAGSKGKSGAAILSTNAAVKTGTGLVTVGIPKGINKAIEKNCIEAMSIPLDETDEGTFSDNTLNKILQIMKDKKTALAIGPGITTNGETKILIKKILLESKMQMVLDADALNIISEDINILKKIKPDIILTPHPGEMARLTNLSNNDVQNNRIEIAREFAKKYG
ncbi:MAG: NAD(P)H-hydrate epimerase, partial [Thermodesulfobacteriota bacterium]